MTIDIGFVKLNGATQAPNCFPSHATMATGPPSDETEPFAPGYVESVFRAVIDDLTNTPPVMHPWSYSIPEDSLVGLALDDPDLTAWVGESQFRFIQPGAQVLVATPSVYNCITVFASCPGGPTFGAHIGPAAFEYGVAEHTIRRRISGGGSPIFKGMSDALKKGYKDVRNSDITISLVGGWALTDPLTQDVKFYKKQKIHTFSAVVLKCLRDCLPGARIDVSRLNRFNGVSWKDRTVHTKLLATARGETYRLAAIETESGKIWLQTTDITDVNSFMVEGSKPGTFELQTIDTTKASRDTDGTVRVPSEVADFIQEYTETNRRVHKHNAERRRNEIPEPVLHEYVELSAA